MKLAGAVLILTASFLIGQTLLMEKKRGLSGLRTLAAALSQLRGELSTYEVTLSKGFNKAAGLSEGMGRELMHTVAERLDDLGDRTFAEIWSGALGDCCAGMEEAVLSQMQGLGNVLGKFDLSLQLQALDNCIALLQDRIKKEKDDYPLQRKLLLSTLLTLGSFLVIIIY